jgi:hypothetical protein
MVGAAIADQKRSLAPAGSSDMLGPRQGLFPSPARQKARPDGMTTPRLRSIATLANDPMIAPLAALQTHPWAFPALETAHIVGISILVGNLVLFEARLFGLGSTLALRPLARLALPLAVLGFGLAAFTGMLMFATQPSELLPNPAFRLKMLLLLLAGSNAVWFHARGSLERVDLLGRVLGGSSLLLWLGVLACGRAIAYV